VLEEACRQGARWHAARTAAGEPPLTVTVNVSGRQLQRATFVDEVRATLARTGFPASHLVLELTESVVLGNPEVALARLTALRALGVRIAIDDFGTGYSALSYLQQYPIDVLKIDKSFVDRIADGGRPRRSPGRSSPSGTRCRCAPWPRAWRRRRSRRARVARAAPTGRATCSPGRSPPPRSTRSSPPTPPRGNRRPADGLPLADRWERPHLPHRNIREVAMDRVELVRGTLDVMILKALTWGPRHGYAVTRGVSEATDGRLDIVEGALYPALHRLERRGLVSSEWGLSENNRQARYYRSRRPGRRQLVADVSAWREYVELLGRVLAAEGA
jgi:transcriptional regulator